MDAIELINENIESWKNLEKYNISKHRTAKAKLVQTVLMRLKEDIERESAPAEREKAEREKAEREKHWFVKTKSDLCTEKQHRYIYMVFEEHARQLLWAASNGKFETPFEFTVTTEVLSKVIGDE